MAIEKHPKARSRSEAPASDMDGAPNPYIMDLVYNYLNDHGYYKATHGIRIETQKRESAKGQSQPASWQGKAQDLPSLEKLFVEWKKHEIPQTSSSSSAMRNPKHVSPKDVPLPESDDSSADASSSGDESDDESSSATDSDSDSDESDEDESMEEADHVKPIAAQPVGQASTATATKRKRSPSTSSSDESSESESDASSDDSTDESEGRPAAKKTKVAAASSEDEDSEDTSSEEESEDEAVEAVEAAKVPLPESSDDSSDSDSDEEDSSEESNGEPTLKAAKSSTVRKQQPAQTKKTNVPTSGPSDDSSESDSDEVGEASSSSSTSSSESDSDSDSSSEAESPITQPTTNETSSVEDHKGSESSETLAHPSPDFQPVSISDDNIHPSRKRKLDGLEASGPISSKQLKKKNIPFSRIRDDTVVDPRLSSNAYVPYDYAQRAHEKLIVTKGKGFTKEKNKGKRGSYRGGLIDIQGTKGIKFDD